MGLIIGTPLFSILVQPTFASGTALSLLLYCFIRLEKKEEGIFDNSSMQNLSRSCKVLDFLLCHLFLRSIHNRCPSFSFLAESQILKSPGTS